MTVKLCIDCRYHHEDKESVFPDKCSHPTLQQSNIDYVRGVRLPTRKPPCDMERVSGARCGPEGKLFEPVEDDRHDYKADAARELDRQFPRGDDA